MGSAERKLIPLSLICQYPLISTFLMSLIWQFAQVYTPHFLGGYYFKWVYLYTADNTDWLGADKITASRIYYFIYIFGYLLLLSFSLWALLFRNGKAIAAWGICFLWLADCGWVVYDMISSELSWNGIICLAEHVVFILWTIVFSLFYLRLKRSDPGLFCSRPRKKKSEKKYQSRF